MANHAGMRLGKHKPKIDRRTLAFVDYAKPALASAPMSCDNTASLHNLGPMLNDEIGDCTCAGVGHLIQQWTAENGNQVILSDDIIENLYKAFGYVPGDEATDNGAAMLDVLNYWRKNTVDNHLLKAYVAIDPQDGQQVTNGIFYFGALYLGLELPLSCQTQDVWDIPLEGGTGTSGRGAIGSWGGHCVTAAAYSCEGLYVITWGQLKKITWKFLRTYCDEAYVCLSPDWFSSNGKAPSGFDFAQLMVDLNCLV